MVTDETETFKYDGYTSCPLATGYGKCMMAEFDGNLLETFPLDQSKERRSLYYSEKDILPELYWKLLKKGLSEGPAPYRKLMKLGMGETPRVKCCCYKLNGVNYWKKRI